MEHYWRDLPGPNWFSGFDLYARFVASVTGPAVAVELGSWKGRSTSFMGVEIENAGKPITFYAVDHWRGSVGQNDQETDPDVRAGRLFEVFQANIAPVARHVSPIRSDTVEAASRFDEGSIDFLYVDAAHTYEGVLRDLDAWFPKVRTGGIICGDDWLFETGEDGFLGVRHAVQDFFACQPAVVTIHDAQFDGQSPNWPQWSMIKTPEIRPSGTLQRSFRQLSRAPRRVVRKARRSLSALRA